MTWPRHQPLRRVRAAVAHEIQDIPPQPRQPRWRAVLWHCWPLAFAGFLLGIYGGVLTLMLTLARGGKPEDDRRLDANSRQTQGVVTAIEGGPTDPRGQAPMRLRYRFEPSPGRELSGRSFLDRPGTEIGERIPIEYAPGAPHISRAVGGRLSSGVNLARFFFRLFFLPGAACVLLWLVLVLRLRRILRHGDLAAAELCEVRVLRYVQPGMLSVRYRFKDHSAQGVAAWHWVRRRSVLGQRIESRPQRLAVVHDRDHPSRSRLVMADDFLNPTPAAGREQQPA